MKLNAAQLTTAVAAVAPIEGISVGTYGDSATVRIFFTAAATAPQRTAAQGVVDSWDWSDAAEAVRDNSDQRALAQAALSDPNAADKLLRAVLLVVLDELNLHAAKMNAILTAIDSGATLAQVKTNIAAITDYPTRTATQLRTAVTNKISAGDADN